MHRIARRTAGFTAAFAAVALIAAGCGENDPGESGAQGATTTAEGSAAQTPGAGGSADETKIATPAGEITVAGPILEKYTVAGGAQSPLGLPTEAEQTAPGGGKYQDFEGGAIYWNDKVDAHVVWGEIRKAWEADGGPEGSLGYPLSDEKDIPAGKQSDFENGRITFVGGQTEVVKN